MKQQDWHEIFHFPSRVHHMFSFNTRSVYRTYTAASLFDEQMLYLHWNGKFTGCGCCTK